LRLIFGFGISLGLGAWITPKLLNWVRGQIKKKAKQINGITDDEYETFVGLPYLPPLIMGTSERFFFTILVAFNISGVGIVMVAWIGLKMSTDWHLIIKENAKSWQRNLAFSGILGSIFSLFFASVGGLVISHWHDLKFIFFPILSNGGFYMDTQALGEMLTVSTFYFLSKNVVLPILIAIITYVLVDRLGEWKSRRNDCKLGIAILDSLLGEIRTGLNLMNSTYAQAQQGAVQPPIGLLPSKTWDGMQTITDQVLLRIIATSKDIVARSFRPRAIRNVCKDYFDHMCSNYNAIINKLLSPPGMTQQIFCTQLLGLLGPNQGKYLAITQEVIEMLEQTMDLLEQNSKRWFPK